VEAVAVQEQPRTEVEGRQQEDTSQGRQVEPISLVSAAAAAAVPPCMDSVEAAVLVVRMDLMQARLHTVQVEVVLVVLPETQRTGEPALVGT
jgi:hypothetical protein